MSVNLQSAVASSRCHPSPLLLPSIDIFLCFAFVQWLYRFSAFLCICTTAIEFLRFSPPDFLLLNIMTSAILNLPFPDLLPWLRFALVLLTLLPASAVIRFCGVGPLCTNSFCCYSVLRSLTSSYKQKIPRFIDHFINGTKTPMLLLNTGNKSARIGVKHKCLHKNWRDFILGHQLQHNETLVFVPESENIFTVLIFDDTGVEKIFPWYHAFNICSDA
ncbi:uncharacterized protein [Coffea arabica]|uniref:Uncharacterized protein isoform X3 n=1 Tax=Coffea arabica TaxID=13443 RepID=A0ABM4USU5_COFAR